METSHERENRQAWRSDDWVDKKKMVRHAWFDLAAGKKDLVGVASAHYSAAGSAHAKNGAIFHLRYLFHGFWAVACLALAYWKYGGFEHFNSDQLDVCQRTLLTIGQQRRAREAVAVGLRKVEEEGKKGVHHTDAFLRIASVSTEGSAWFTIDYAPYLLGSVVAAVENVSVSDPQQEVRVLKQAAQACQRIYEETAYTDESGKTKQFDPAGLYARELFLKASALAEERGLDDQVAKIHKLFSRTR